MNKSLLISLVASILTPALGHAESAITVGISAHVDMFCHVYTPQNNNIDVVGGRAQIGQIREICNTPNGYEVSTAFTNLSAGQLDVGDMAYVINSQGVAVRDSNEPAVRSLNWRLEGAQLASASMPVVMRVTISPR